jgi:DNA-binding transcriptional MerR regulator
MPAEPLLTTVQLARQLGISRTSVIRYEQRGWITPERTLPSGHRRWSLEDVKAQLDALRERGEDT